MSDESERLPTGVGGLDAILMGGLFRGGVYLVSGPPGAGKTILGNQVCFTHARRGGKAIFCTLLAETHGRMLANIRKLSFFDEHAVGSAITFLEGFSTLEQSGLDGALKLLRGSVRDHQATLIVIDGTVTAEKMSPSDIAYKKFIQGLKSWVDVLDCTVILLTSSGSDMHDIIKPEHTMVDGVLQLATRPLGMKMLRELCVRKFRGSANLEGFHSYAITDDGVVTWPRTEALLAKVEPSALCDERLPFGIPRFDAMIDGGVCRNSVTLLVGATGSGKTQLGLQFLADGVARGEQCLYFGLFEPPSLIEKVARALGVTDGPKGRLSIVWQSDRERLPDALAADLLHALDTTKARRVLIDGMVAFKTAAGDIDRLPGFFAALMNELRRRGVTTMLTEELRDVIDSPLYVPVDNFSANCDNIIFLRQLEREGAIVRHISVAKTRGTRHDPAPRLFDVTSSGIEVAASSTDRGRRSKRGPAKTRKRKR
jgi:circadian clock protein KaiC